MAFERQSAAVQVHQKRTKDGTRVLNLGSLAHRLHGFTVRNRSRYQLGLRIWSYGKPVSAWVVSKDVVSSQARVIHKEQEEQSQAAGQGHYQEDRRA